MKHPKIVIDINVVDVMECVYKIHYNGKYIVVMAKSMYRSVWSINDDLERYHRGVNEKFNKNNLYSKFYDHVLNSPKSKFTFEMILISNNAYQLLKHSQIELDRGKQEGNCLNTYFSPYINRDLQKPLRNRKTNWWVNRGSYLNFCNWRKKHPFPAF